MKGNIQLHIPMPCSEKWENMQPREKGRYCGVCSKTVVDFSMMSDREIIAYLSRAGQHVCGRMAADQLSRAIPLRAEGGKSRGVWWKWLLAGLLVSSEASAQRHSVATVKATPPKNQVESYPLFQGPMTVSRVLPDSIPENEIPRGIVQQISVDSGLCVVAGGLVARPHRRANRAARAADSVVQWMRDTVSTIGLAPKKEWSVYPNPVWRGAAVMITWQTAGTGSYEVGLFDTQGTLVKRQVMEVNSKEQVDLLDIPSSLAPGTYFLRSASKGKTITRTLVVL